MGIKKSGLIIVIFIFFFLSSVFGHSSSDLQKYIPIVKPNYPNDIIRLLRSLMITYGEQNNNESKQLSKLLETKIKDYHWINGFIIEDDYGNKVILTNGNLIREVDKVTLVIFSDNKVYSVSDVPISYIDFNSLIAVIPFPPQMEKFAKGFKLGIKKTKINTPIIIAGYSHDGLKPVWNVYYGSQVSGGTHEHDIDLPGEGLFLVHTILKDLKEDGKPVLTENVDNPSEYEVIGMSVSQEDLEMGIALAYPSKIIFDAINNYNRSFIIHNDPQLLEQELLKNINLFQNAVNSNIGGIKKFRILTHLISYNYSFNEGLNIFLSQLKKLKSDEKKNKMVLSFISAPTQEIKSLIIDRIYSELIYKNSRNIISFKKLNLNKDELLKPDSVVESIFKLTDRDFKITWIFEQGTWKIGDFDFTPVDEVSKYKLEYNRYRRRLNKVKEPFIVYRKVVPKPKNKRTKKKCLKSNLLIGLSVTSGLGTQYIYESGNNPYVQNPSYIIHWSGGLIADYIISPNILLTYGLKYTRKGSTYEAAVDPNIYGTDSIEIEEVLNYWEIPLILRTNHKMKFGIGFGLNFLSSEKGSYHNGITAEYYQLNKSYFDSLSKFNISVILTLSRWFNLGKRMVLEVEGGLDAHLGKDWPHTGESSRYYNFYIGTSVKYRITPLKDM